MVQPLDLKLWQQAKQMADKKYRKPSAYKSGYIVQYYKRHGGTFATPNKPSRQGLTRWFQEQWRNQRNQVGYKKPGDLYRPTKRITSQTPVTWQELSPAEIRQARHQKQTRGRVIRFQSRKALFH